MASLYETDYYGWTQQVASALREGRVEGLNLEEIAEEIEDLGQSQRRSLQSAIHQILLHLLKWDYQPELRSRSWVNSIDKQRDRLQDILQINPSLKRFLKDVQFMESAYRWALRDAVYETNLDNWVFPATCLYSLEEITQAKRELQK